MVDWKIKGLYKADAGLVYDEITSIGDEVTPEQIVDYAKDKDTELHKCFEWKDRISAHKYRLSQAQSIIRNIVYIKDYKDEDENDKQLMSTTYRCTIHCPLHKSCYIVKTNRPLPDDTTFLVKCPARHHDIAIMAKDARVYNNYPKH